MPLQAAPPRKQHFKYGKIPFASKGNTFIYGSPCTAKVQQAVKPESKPNVDNLRLLYGTNENTRSIMEHSYNRANIVAVEAKTSADIRRKAQQAIDGRKEYAKFLERKKQLSEETKEEKRKDLELLKTYKPPWWDHGHKNEYHKPQGKPMKEEDFPVCLRFGKPGNGAPLRSDSGNVKTVIQSDPETRFQKRNRQQTLDVLEPTLGHRRRNPRTSSINVLGQRKWLRPGNVAPLPAPCDILGAPVTRSEQRPLAAKNPAKRQNEKKVAPKHQNEQTSNGTQAEVTVKTEATEKMVAGEVERTWGNMDQTIQNRLPQLKPPVTAVEKNQRHGNKEKTLDDFFDPWGRAGGGAPNRDGYGNVMTQKKKGELVASFRKSEEEKELERKEIEAKMSKVNADNNADVTYIENGNYYRMHLDARKKEVVFPPATQAARTNNLNMGNMVVVETQPKPKPRKFGSFAKAVRNKVLPGVRRLKEAQAAQEKENMAANMRAAAQSQRPTDPLGVEDDNGTNIDKSPDKGSPPGHQDAEDHRVIQSLVSNERYVPSAQENHEKQKSMLLTAGKGKRDPSPSDKDTSDKNEQQRTSTTPPRQNQRIEDSETRSPYGLHALDAHHRSRTMVKEDSPQHDLSATNSDEFIERFSSHRNDHGGAPLRRSTSPTEPKEERKGPVLSESLKRKLEMKRASQV